MRKEKDIFKDVLFDFTLSLCGHLKPEGDLTNPYGLNITYRELDDFIEKFINENNLHV